MKKILFAFLVSITFCSNAHAEFEVSSSGGSVGVTSVKPIDDDCTAVSYSSDGYEGIAFIDAAGDKAAPGGINGRQSNSSCLTCRSNQIGYLEGGTGGDFTGASYDCDDPDAKAAAVQAVLDHYNATDAFGDSGSCVGVCVFGSCMANGLTASNNDGCEFSHTENGDGTCFYSVDCGPGHTPDFSLKCGCE